MALFSLVSAFVVIAYFGIGLYVLRKNSRFESNRVFFILSLCLTLWALGTHFFNHAANIEEGWALFGFFSFAWFFSPPLLFHFFLLLTGIWRRTSLRSVSLYLPGLALFTASKADSYAIVKTAQPLGIGWKLIYNSDSFWYYFNIANYTGFILLSIVLVFRWGLGSESGRVKKQARAILLSLIPPMVAGTVVGTIFPILGIGGLPPLGYIFFAFWILGIGYAVGKYELLTLTPAVASEEVISKVMDAVLLLDKEKTILKANKIIESFTGYTEKDLLGRKVADFLVPFEASAGETEENLMFVTNFMARNGVGIPLRVSLSAIRGEGKETIGYVFAGQDLRLTRKLEEEIRERERIAEAYRKSEEKFQKAFLRSPVGHSLNLIPSGEFLAVNEAALSVLGYRREDVVGKSDLDLGLWINAEDRDRVLRELLRSVRIGNREAELRDGYGRIRTVQLSAETLLLEGGRCALFTMIDVTEKKELEREVLRMQKFESLGVLAGGLAHDFNNLIMAILGNVSLGKMYAEGSDERLLDSLEDAEKACFHARDLTTRLLSLTKSDSAPKKRLDLAVIVRRAAATMAGSGSRYLAEILAQEDLWPMEGDDLAMSQVFGNLIMNAFQAMPKGGGKVEILLENLEIGEGLPVFREPGRMFPRKAGRYVAATVSDKGCGMSEEVLGRIFDPYFTTKEQGTGLGLSVVYSIIKNHDASIFVRSSLNRGTDFFLYFPALRETGEEQGS